MLPQSETLPLGQLQIFKLSGLPYGTGYELAEDARDFTIFHGIPFYKSTGKNSHAPGTWLPFYNTLECFDTGYIVKRACDAISGEYVTHKKYFQELADQIIKEQKHTISLTQLTKILYRFGSPELMHYSATLGGGIWDTPLGASIKTKSGYIDNKIQLNFPAEAEVCEEYEVDPPRDFKKGQVKKFLQKHGYQEKCPVEIFLDKISLDRYWHAIELVANKSSIFRQRLQYALHHNIPIKYTTLYDAGATYLATAEKEQYPEFFLTIPSIHLSCLADRKLSLGCAVYSRLAPNYIFELLKNLKPDEKKFEKIQWQVIEPEVLTASTEPLILPYETFIPTSSTVGVSKNKHKIYLYNSNEYVLKDTGVLCGNLLAIMNENEAYEYAKHATYDDNPDKKFHIRSFKQQWKEAITYFPQAELCSDLPNERMTLSNQQIVLEKLAYDLYKLCGIKIPDVKLVEEQKSDGSIQLHIASRIEKGYKDLNYYTQKYGEEIFKTQKIDGKPIIGLFETLGISAFLWDHDFTGPIYSNIGIIETDTAFIAIKIDPGMASLYKLEDGRELLPHFREDLHSDMILDYFDIDFAKNPDLLNIANVFAYTTKEQKLAGLQKVANLTDADLRNIIFNDSIPLEYLSSTIREAIYAELIARRNYIRKLYHLEPAETVTAVATTSARNFDAECIKIAGPATLAYVLNRTPQENHLEVFRSLGKDWLKNNINNFQTLGSIVKDLNEATQQIVLANFDEIWLRHNIRKPVDFTFLMSNLKPTNQEIILEKIGLEFLIAKIYDLSSFCDILRGLPESFHQRFLDTFGKDKLLKLVKSKNDLLTIYAAAKCPTLATSLGADCLQQLLPNLDELITFIKEFKGENTNLISLLNNHPNLKSYCQKLIDNKFLFLDIIENLPTEKFIIIFDAIEISEFQKKYDPHFLLSFCDKQNNRQIIYSKVELKWLTNTTTRWLDRITFKGFTADNEQRQTELLQHLSLDYFKSTINTLEDFEWRLFNLTPTNQHIFLQKLGASFLRQIIYNEDQLQILLTKHIDDSWCKYLYLPPATKQLLSDLYYGRIALSSNPLTLMATMPKDTDTANEPIKTAAC